LINFAEAESHIQKVLEWFALETIFEVSITKEIQHNMVKTIFSSKEIP